VCGLLTERGIKAELNPNIVLVHDVYMVSQ
jgi:hypothetical protein